ncbi:MAG: hypothetical protein CM15mP79_0120 [Methanobacteriota archaeon]|nr:MAG: hypothetical protein CM15mP79_0120 [Euryarchaeota archaeon]
MSGDAVERAMTPSDVVRTVLVVDSTMNVLRLTELLQGRGFEVSVCETGTSLLTNTSG